MQRIQDAAADATQAKKPSHCLDKDNKDHGYTDLFYSAQQKRWVWYFNPDLANLSRRATLMSAMRNSPYAQRHNLSIEAAYSFAFLKDHNMKKGFAPFVVEPEDLLRIYGRQVKDPASFRAKRLLSAAAEAELARVLATPTEVREKKSHHDSGIRYPSYHFIAASFMKVQEKLENHKDEDKEDEKKEERYHPNPAINSRVEQEIAAAYERARIAIREKTEAIARAAAEAAQATATPLIPTAVARATTTAVLKATAGRVEDLKRSKGKRIKRITSDEAMRVVPGNKKESSKPVVKKQHASSRVGLYEKKRRLDPAFNKDHLAFLEDILNLGDENTWVLTEKGYERVFSEASLASAACERYTREAARFYDRDGLSDLVFYNLKTKSVTISWRDGEGEYVAGASNSLAAFEKVKADYESLVAKRTALTRTSASHM